MDITSEADFDITPAELWAWLTEFERFKLWNDNIVSDEPVSDGPVGPGYVSDMTMRDGGKVNVYRSELIDYDVNERLTMVLSGGNLGETPMTISYRITPTATGSHLVYRTHWQPRGLLMTLMAPLIAIMSRRNVRAQHDALRKAIAAG
ncbi:SRPBCC family protein [Devosia sp.]|uniref:SRPBCC family protein n=1 Tax=Devosia sp. TaxID=1871048 RepID=UPI003A8CABF5